MSRSTPLTDKQRLTLDFIEHYIIRHTVSPKLQEIADGIGIRSRGVAHRYVQALIDQHFISQDKHKHRGIQLLKTNPHRVNSV
jgi:repressor LexA